MTKSVLHYFLMVLSLVFCIKGLGGSFNALFTYLNLDLFHGPIVGTCLGLSLTGFFLTCKPFAKFPLTFTKNQSAFLSLLFFIPLVLGMVQRILMIENTPLDINRADMLFAIQAEITAFLKGQNPYGPVFMSDGREVLHGYPPMLWLSYLPLSVLKWDLRYLNVFAQCLFYLFLLDLFLRKKSYWFKNPYSNIALFLSLFLLHLFSKQATRQPIDVHTGPYWLYWTVFLWLVSRNQLHRSFWFIPLLLLCREPAILFLLPLAILIFQNQRKLFFEALWRSLVVGGLIAVPFIIWDPLLYFKGIKFYSQHIYENPLEIMLRFYGLSGILKMTETLWMQKPLQCVGVLLASFVLIRNHKKIALHESLALGGVAYLWLMLFVSLSYPFIYTELIILFYALILWPENIKQCKAST